MFESADTEDSFQKKKKEKFFLAEITATSFLTRLSGAFVVQVPV